MSRSCALAIAFAVVIGSYKPSLAQVGPPVTPGFPNVPQIAGTVLSGLNAPEQGRTAVIAYHNGVLFTVPEIPSSQPGADFQVRTWDISDPTSPTEIAQWGTTTHPINAHGYFKSGDYLVVGHNHGQWSFLAGTPGQVTRTTFPDMLCPWTRGCLFQPWFVDQTYWSYDAVGGNATISLDWNELASWDHLGLTGVIGHPFLIGDLLIFASDQSRTGVATYDVSDPTNPTLLDVLTTGGPGGYWPEVWGGDGKLYVVFPYRTGGNGMRVVDATDPANLQFVIDRPLPGAASMYIQFQDEYAFMGSHKVDMRSLQSVQFFDPGSERPNEPGVFGIDTSQHLLPIGNLLVTGGIGPDEGMAIWAHQDAPDTRGPAVGYHIPQEGRTNYPVGGPISLLIHETLESFTIVNGQTFIVRPVGGSAIAGRITWAFDDILTFTPTDPLLPNTTYEVVLPEGGIKDAAGNGMNGYSFTFSTGSTVGGNQAPLVAGLDVSAYPVAPSSSVTLTADANDPDGDPLEYRFDFGDGTPKTAWSSSASTIANYAEAGHYRPTVQVRDDSGAIGSAAATVTVVETPGGPAPSQSAPVVCDEGGRRIWTVNPDNDSLTAVDADTLAVLFEVPVCADPRSVARSGTGELWITCYDGDLVQVRDAAGGWLADIDMGYGSAPVDVAITPDGGTAYVTLEGNGELARFDTASRALTGTLTLGPRPRAIAISGDGARILVTRFLSPRHHGEVWDVAASTFTLSRTIEIPKFGGDGNRDTTASGKGIANYLAGIAISPDGASAWVAANKPNHEAGPLSGGPDIDQDNSVRNIVVQLDLVANRFERAIDIDNSDSSRAIAFSPLGDYMFVALQGNNEVAVFDTLSLDGTSGLAGFVTRLGTELAPQGVCVDATTNRVFVKNFMDRSLTMLEADALFRFGDIGVSSNDVPVVTTEALSPAVLNGKQIFYNASDPRMSAEGYLSCATCHVDGGHDGRVWDFTGRGEGLRNTTTLRSRAGMAHGNVHWTGNFDEIQDFENDIRGGFGGAGFLSDGDFATTSSTLGPAKAGLSADLDDLAAYVASLDASNGPRSPYRNFDGTLTAEALAGRDLFTSLSCHSCHAGETFTDSQVGPGNLHDVGSLRTTSGQRLGSTLTGIDAPTLIGLWDTAPYFHDGSAPELADTLTISGGTVVQAESGTVSGGAAVSDQWVDLNHDDTVRSRAFVNMNAEGGRVTLDGIDGGSGGVGAIEIRYSIGYWTGELQVSAGGADHPVHLPMVGNDPGWRHVNWETIRVEGVNWSAGPTNQVELTVLPGGSTNISIDEVVVSTADDLAAAAPHRVATALSAAERADLVSYLQQLDGSVGEAPAPPATATTTAAPTMTPTPTPISTLPGGVADSLVRYKVKVPRRDGAGVTIERTLPRPWTIHLDNIFLDNASLDDPENFEVRKVTGWLSPARWNDAAPPNDPSLHYVAYQTKEAREGAGAMLPTGRFPRAERHAGRTWMLENAFGTIRVVSTRVRSFFLPAGQSLDPNTPPISPGDETHYLCYQAKPTRDETAQTPGGRFDRSLQAFVVDSLDDCALDVEGGTSFPGTPVAGRCLYDFRKVKELCVPVDKSTVTPPRESTADGVSGSTASGSDALLCYQAKLSKRVMSQAVASLLGANVGDALAARQEKHDRRTVRDGDAIAVAPSNQFPVPTLVETNKVDQVCVPTTVRSVE